MPPPVSTSPGEIYVRTRMNPHFYALLNPHFYAIRELLQTATG